MSAMIVMTPAVYADCLYSVFELDYICIHHAAVPIYRIKCANVHLLVCTLVHFPSASVSRL